MFKFQKSFFENGFVKNPETHEICQAKFSKKENYK